MDKSIINNTAENKKSLLFIMPVVFSVYITAVLVLALFPLNIHVLVICHIRTCHYTCQYPQQLEVLYKTHITQPTHYTIARQEQRTGKIHVMP